MKDILFQPKESRACNDLSLKDKYFKILKKYVKVKSRIKLFLNDEINNLND